MEEKRTPIQPYPYQTDGINKMLSMKRCINGDACGLGKSLMSIVAVERAGAVPCLVICPSALKINWQREVEKFTNLRPLVLTDTNREAFPFYIGMSPRMYDVVICNYESLAKFFVKDLGEKPLKLKNFIFSKAKDMLKSVIIDESHRIKDPSTRQSKICMGLCHGKEYIFQLTGTPVVNMATDLACQIAILGRMKEFGSYNAFMARYAENENAQELRDRLQSFYFSRDKRVALPDLPELTRTKITVELSKRVQIEYDQCEQDIRTWLAEYKGCTDSEIRRKLRNKALITFMNLRAIAARGKVDAAIQFIKDMQGEPVTIFCEHHAIVDELLEAFPDAVCVTGRQNSVEKQASVDAFQSGQAKIIICSIKAAGVGITLTAGSHELFVQLPWTFSDLTQCEARQYRNGQKNAVNSWVLIGKNTIDRYLYHLIMQKGSIASRVTGSEDDAIKDEKYFDELVDLFTNSNFTEEEL